MGLGKIVSNAIKTVDKVTKDLQPQMTHEAKDGTDAYGKPKYKAGVSLRILLEASTRVVDVDAFTKQTATHQITVLSSTVFTDDDRITLPDGTQPRILQVRPLYDKDGNVEMTELFCSFALGGG